MEKRTGLYPCLSLENLSKDFGGLRAVNSVNLTVSPGERFVLIGPNGAGKTTLFNLLSGELQVSEGRVVYFGKDITGLPPYKRAALGIARTFQITNLFPNLTVLDNLLLGCQALERTKFVMFRYQSSYRALMEKSMNLLKEGELWDKRNELVKHLSHGDKRQIEVLLALTGESRLLLLDEPTAGLSQAETKSLSLLIRRLDPAMTIVLIEHDMDVAFGFAERIAVLHQWRLLAEGTKEQIKSSPIVQQIYLGEG
jgi:branched-chain amino acid transport system ATP-binding protein